MIRKSTRNVNPVQGVLTLCLCFHNSQNMYEVKMTLPRGKVKVREKEEGAEGR